MARVRDNKRPKITMSMKLTTRTHFSLTRKLREGNRNIYVTARALEECHWQDAEDKLHNAIATQIIKDISNLPGGISLHVKFRITVP